MADTISAMPARTRRAVFSVVVQATAWLCSDPAHAEGPQSPAVPAAQYESDTDPQSAPPSLKESAIPPVPNAAPAEVPALPPPPIPEATLSLWPNGKPATITCSGQPITQSVCRYSDFSGTLTTYYTDGSVAQVLSFTNGILEGLAERYDGGGHLISREYFHDGKPRSPTNLPAGVSVFRDTPLPPPPTFGEQSGVVTTPRISLDAADRDRLRGIVGLGLRGSIGFLVSNAVIPFHLGGVLQVIPNLRRVRPEFSIGATFALRNDYARVDVPLSVGIQADLFPGADTIYLLLAANAAYSHRWVQGNVPGPQSETGWFTGGEAGVGVRLRSGPASYWLGDLRVGGMGRVDSATRILIPQPDGPPEPALGNHSRMTLNLSFVGNLGA